MTPSQSLSRPSQNSGAPRARVAVPVVAVVAEARAADVDEAVPVVVLEVVRGDLEVGDAVAVVVEAVAPLWGDGADAHRRVVAVGG